jgi:hypothetical protein
MNSTRNTVKLAVITVIAAAIVAGYACGKKPKPAIDTTAPGATPSPSASQPGPEIIGAAEAKITDRPLKFDHNRAEHKKQDCTLCHKRMDNGPAPTFPQHAACISCHAADYTTQATKLCEVCHVTPLAAQPKLISFPMTLGQFGLKGFSHKEHLDASKMPAGTSVPKCDLCHHFDGSFVQASFPAHPECYSCHSHQPGEKLGSCQTCHVDQGQSLKYRKGTATADSLYNFTHGGHFRQAGLQQNCEKCHHLAATASSGNLPDIGQINTARGQRHTSACWSCHVQAKEPICTKCHVGGTPL